MTPVQTQEPAHSDFLEELCAQDDVPEAEFNAAGALSEDDERGKEREWGDRSQFQPKFPQKLRMGVGQVRVRVFHAVTGEAVLCPSCRVPIPQPLFSESCLMRILGPGLLLQTLPVLRKSGIS